jgi:NAD(P)-dependent dehydrogenase (short-subunit alcohol dehydrogenase family)
LNSNINSTILHGKTILITGASRGIGKALSKACAGEGAHVIACGRNVQDLEVLSDEIETETNGLSTLLPINLATANVDDYRTVAEHIGKQFGTLDAVVLNAAMLGEVTPCDNYSLKTWIEVFQVNLHSAVMLLQATRSLLKESALRTVIFTLASEGIAPKANWGAYAASKSALGAFMKIYALENSNSEQFRVAGVLPPPTKTLIRMTAYPAENHDMLAKPEAVVSPYIKLLTQPSHANQGSIL